MILDTSKAVRKQQVSIILSKTPQERVMMGVDMIDVTYNLIKKYHRSKEPGNIKRRARR